MMYVPGIFQDALCTRIQFMRVFGEAEVIDGYTKALGVCLGGEAKGDARVAPPSMLGTDCAFVDGSSVLYRYP